MVLYDNLLERADRPELHSVVAHELGHVAHDDIPRGLAFVALVAPLGLLFARELALAIARRTGADPASPAAIPAYLLALALAALSSTSPATSSRARSRRAPTQFALELTHDPEALIDLQVSSPATNLSDPDPPGLYSCALRHPPDHGRADRRRAGLRAGTARD